MPKVAIGLDDKDIQELNEIIMDKDKEGALKFLKDKIQFQILGKEKGKLDVIGKMHL
jgi:hypothetical protein